MSEQAVLKLATQTGEAVVAALEALLPGQPVGNLAASVVATPEEALAGLSTPAVLSSVAYLGGVTGGNAFALGTLAAQRIAAAMMGSDPAAVEAGELGELELSAVAEAANQMMAAGAAAIGGLLDQAVEITPPDTRVVESLEGALGDVPAAYVTIVTFSVCGEACRLVQLVPNAFVVRMSSALDGVADETVGGGSSAQVGDALRGLTLRLSASLGAAELPVADVLGVGSGAVVELDRDVDEPIELFLNGTPFATGRLVVADDGEWAVRVERLAEDPPFTASTADPTPEPISQGGN